jgi:hypothetical protein
MTVASQLRQNPKHFLVIGNGGGGTSLLRGLLNAHSRIECLFEHKGGDQVGYPPGELETWLSMAHDADDIWGNKIPIEQFITRHYEDADILKLAEHFKIIWLIRRFSRYWKGKNEEGYKKNWEWSQHLYWEIRELWPTRIIQVNFEDLVIRPAVELRRICGFLKVRYEKTMIEGTLDTGYKVYDQAGINMERA